MPPADFTMAVVDERNGRGDRPEIRQEAIRQLTVCNDRDLGPSRAHDIAKERRPLIDRDKIGQGEDIRRDGLEAIAPWMPTRRGRHYRYLPAPFRCHRK